MVAPPRRSDDSHADLPIRRAAVPSGPWRSSCFWWPTSSAGPTRAIASARNRGSLRIAGPFLPRLGCSWGRPRSSTGRGCCSGWPKSGRQSSSPICRSRAPTFWICARLGRGCSQRATCRCGSSAVETLGPQGDRCGNRHRRSCTRVPAGHASRGGYAGPVVPHRARHSRDPAGVWRESRRWTTTASSHTCRGRPPGTRHRRPRLDRLPSGLCRSARAHQRWTRLARRDLPIREGIVSVIHARTRAQIERTQIVRWCRTEHASAGRITHTEPAIGSPSPGRRHAPNRSSCATVSDANQWRPTASSCSHRSNAPPKSIRQVDDDHVRKARVDALRSIAARGYGSIVALGLVSSGPSELCAAHLSHG